MRAYVAKRLLIAGAPLLGMSVLIFVLMRLAPGNITDIIFESAGYVDEADRKRLEAELGIDAPVAVQYTRWLGEIVRGELGKSYRYDLPAWQIIRPRLPVTLELAVLALAFSVLLGVPTGVISAIRQDRPLDYLLRVLSLPGLSMPSFWRGLIVTETVFNLPGVARYLVDAIQVRDYPIVQNLVMLIAVVVVLANLTVDLLYTWLDPRIKYGKA